MGWRDDQQPYLPIVITVAGGHFVPPALSQASMLFKRRAEAS
jgi:hypothetical protein